MNFCVKIIRDDIGQEKCNSRYMEIGEEQRISLYLSVGVLTNRKDIKFKHEYFS